MNDFITTIIGLTYGIMFDIAKNIANISFLTLSITIPALFYYFCRGLVAHKMGDSFILGVIPYLNDYIMYNRLKPDSIGAILYPLCCAGSVYIPFFGAFFMIPAQLVMRAILFHNLAKSFGYGIIFTVGLYTLTPIFMAILAFGNKAYTYDPNLENQLYSHSQHKPQGIGNIKQVPW